MFLSGCFIMRCQLFNTLKSCLLSTKCSSHLELKSVVFCFLGYSGGCVVMRGRSPPGRWEVKDCRYFKAMSLCKQPVENGEKTEQEERWPFHPCYLDWESEPGLASCFKVMSSLHGHSHWDQHYFNSVHVSQIPLFQNCAWHTAGTKLIFWLSLSFQLYSKIILSQKLDKSLVTLKASSQGLISRS